MKNKKKVYPIFEQTKQQVKKLDTDYQEKYHQLVPEVFKYQANPLKANLLLGAIVNKLYEHQQEKGNINAMPKDFIRHVEKGIQYKKLLLLQKQHDAEKLTIAGLWMTMSSVLVFLFIKECLTQHFLISFSVDLMVAAVAFVFAVSGLKTHVEILKRYQLSMKSFRILIVGLIFGLSVTIMTIKNPFDFSFLIMIIAHFTSKKIVMNELELSSS